MLEPPLAEFLTATRWIGRMMGASPSEAADVENGNIQSLLALSPSRRSALNLLRFLV